MLRVTARKIGALLLLWAVLIVAVFVCGTAWAQEWRSRTVGGNGGIPFYIGCSAGMQVGGILVAGGDYIDRIGWCFCPKGSRQSGCYRWFNYGGPGGRVSIFKMFEPGEEIVRISARGGIYVDWMNVETNRRWASTAGGRGGNIMETYRFGGDVELCSFTVRAGKYVDQIGVWTRCTRPGCRSINN
jgi:jacalin-like lectin domain-containing protein